MWFLGSSLNKQCEAARGALELTVSRPDAGEIVALETLLAQLPQSARKHAIACGECRIFADELLEVRTMLQFDRQSRIAAVEIAQPGPYFMARVMAAIAERETEQEKKAQTWAAVPRLAHWLSVLASLTLLIAGSWLYQRPAQPATVAGINAEQNYEGLVEGSGNAVQDDFLLNTADR